jgi:hypothetical protein
VLFRSTLHVKHAANTEQLQYYIPQKRGLFQIVNTLHKGDKYNSNNNSNSSSSSNNNNNNNNNNNGTHYDDDYIKYSIYSYLGDVLCPYQKMPSF